jgi:hypothetical protein
MVTHKLNNKFKKQRLEKSLLSRKAPQKNNENMLITEGAV